MPRVPIACTLTEEGAVERVDEWRAFLAADVEGVEAGDTSARLLLRPGDDVLLRAVDLAEREKACCDFFGFSIDLDGQRRWLTISVPPEATEILRALVSSAGR